MSKQSKQRFDEAFQNLKGKLSTEVLEEVGDLLGTLKREFVDVENDVSSFYKESMTRKESLREKDEIIESLTSEKEKLEKQINESDKSELISNLEKERDDYKGQLTEFIEKQNTEIKGKFLTKFESIKEHKNFDKIKPFLAIAEEKDGKPDWDTVEIEKIKQNLSEIEKFQQTGVLAEDSIRVPGAPPKRSEPVKDIYAEQFG